MINMFESVYDDDQHVWASVWRWSTCLSQCTTMINMLESVYDNDQHVGVSVRQW